MPTRRLFTLAAAAALSAPRVMAAGKAKPPGYEAFHNDQGRSLPLLYLAREQLKAATDEDDRDFAGEAFALAYCVLGDEARALAAAPIAEPPFPESDLSRTHAAAALDTILRAARHRRIVMLGEIHWCSRSRLFAAEVMRVLRREGFNWLAAEAWSREADGALPVAQWRPGKSFLPWFSVYTHDPAFAELVREAVERGYRLGDYHPAAGGKSSSPERAEEAAAETFVANILNVDPAARVLVLCGVGHAMKTAPSLPRFAERLHDLTGIDPLCIDNAYGIPAADHPISKAVQTRFKPRGPVVLRRDHGATLAFAPRAAGTEKAAYDLSVLYPRDTLIDGRPGWLARAPGRKRAAFRLKTPSSGEGEHLIQALHADEPDPTVPADQFLLAEGQGTAAFYLRPGRYRVRLETRDRLDVLGSLIVA